MQIRKLIYFLNVVAVVGLATGRSKSHAQSIVGVYKFQDSYKCKDEFCYQLELRAAADGFAVVLGDEEFVIPLIRDGLIYRFFHSEELEPHSEQAQSNFLIQGVLSPRGEFRLQFVIKRETEDPGRPQWDSGWAYFTKN